MDGQEWTDAIRYRITSGQVNVWAERSGSTTDGGANSPGLARPLPNLSRRSSSASGRLMRPPWR